MPASEGKLIQMFYSKKMQQVNVSRVTVDVTV